MPAVLKILGSVMLAVVLGITLSKQSKDMTVVLTLLVCATVSLGALAYLEPVLNFVESLQLFGQLDRDMAAIMLKAVGISLIAEVACLICADAGFASMGKAIKLLTSATVLWLALPMLESLLELLQRMVGGI